MRSHTTPSLLSAAILAGYAFTSPSHAADCGKEVGAAFEKQRATKGYRMVTRQAHPQGEVVNTFDFVLPDRMYNKVDVPGQPASLETIAIGRWAWANQGGGWQELQPQFAQAVTSDVASTLSAPLEIKEAFVCAGDVDRDGKPFKAYRTEPRLAVPGQPQSAENPMLARTVLVDASTGLPAFNFVGDPAASATPLMSVTYSYPPDIAVEAPDAVPAGRTR